MQMLSWEDNLVELNARPTSSSQLAWNANRGVLLYSEYYRVWQLMQMIA